MKMLKTEMKYKVLPWNSKASFFNGVVVCHTKRKHRDQAVLTYLTNGKKIKGLIISTKNRGRHLPLISLETKNTLVCSLKGTS